MKQTLNILIIEDNQSDAGLIIRHIRKAGYDVVYEIVDCPEALQQSLETKDWHVILSDYNMPLLNGYEALEIVNKFDSNIPFILISGAIGEEAAVSAMKAGACDLIIKDNLLRLVPAIERGIEDAKIKYIAKYSQKVLEEQAEALKKQAHREKILREIAEAAMSSLDSAEIQNKIVTIVANIFKPDKCFIRPFDNEKDAFVSVEKYAEYCSSEDLKKVYCFSDEVEDLVKSEYKKGDAFIVPDFKEFFDKSELFASIAKRQIEHYGIIANYCFPILIEKNLIGAFVLQFKEKTYLEPEDVDLLKTIVNHIAIAIRQAELFTQSQKASKAKSEFLAIMSHEIRTPLSGVNGFLQLLSDTNLTDKQKKYVDNIKTSSESLLSIIGDVLDFSKIEADKIEIEKNEFNLHTLVNDSILNARASGYKKGLDINTHIYPDVPINVIGDSVKLRQVLNNLFNNSIKFTNEGSILLTVKSLTNKDDKIDIYFEVADTGIGISEENIGKVFQPFVQADNVVGRKYGGTGLGLAICDRLVRLMGGNLAIESEINKGSKISFNVEFNSTLDIEKGVIIFDKERMDEPSLNEFKILVVEDNKMNIELFTEILNTIKLKFDLVTNGIEAVKLYKNNHYDLILMDCELPGISGYEATGQIRNLENNEKHIPIIAMTAHAMCGEKEKCLKAGMDAHISKPIDIELFKSMVKGYLIAPPPPPRGIIGHIHQSI